MPVTESLRIAEAFQEDIGSGTARLDVATRNRLEVELGDLVEIQGPKTTAAVVSRAKAEDEGEGLVRAEYVVRRNAGVSMGDRVRVRRIVCPTADSLAIAPVNNGQGKMDRGPGLETFVQKALNLRPFVQGDIFVVPGVFLKDGPVLFVVTVTSPSGIVRVGSETRITIGE